MNRINQLVGQWLQVDHCTWSRGDFSIIRRMDGYYMLVLPGSDAWMDTSIYTIDNAIKWVDHIIDQHYGGCDRVSDD